MSSMAPASAGEAAQHAVIDGQARDHEQAFDRRSVREVAHDRKIVAGGGRTA
jgi:hypothetical protein